MIEKPMKLAKTAHAAFVIIDRRDPQRTRTYVGVGLISIQVSAIKARMKEVFGVEPEMQHELEVRLMATRRGEPGRQKAVIDKKLCIRRCQEAGWDVVNTRPGSNHGRTPSRRTKEEEEMT